MTRADRHNNPTAFTVNVAITAGLILNKDYVVGDPFPSDPQEYTAKLLGDDPVGITIRVMDKLGFYTKAGRCRWMYADGPIGIPSLLWNSLSRDQKKILIHYLYIHEGGIELEKYFK